LEFPIVRTSGRLLARFAEMLRDGPYLGLARPAGRVSVLSADEAAVAEGRRAGEDDGQGQYLAGKAHDFGLDMFAEQEHAEQAGRQRVQDGEPGLRCASGPAASACEASSIVAAPTTTST
jgi:hypothetical protein